MDKCPDQCSSFESGWPGRLRFAEAPDFLLAKDASATHPMPDINDPDPQPTPGPRRSPFPQKCPDLAGASPLHPNRRAASVSWRVLHSSCEPWRQRSRAAKTKHHRADPPRRNARRAFSILASRLRKLAAGPPELQDRVTIYVRSASVPIPTKVSGPGRGRGSAPAPGAVAAFWGSGRCSPRVTLGRREEESITGEAAFSGVGGRRSSGRAAGRSTKCPDRTSYFISSVGLTRPDWMAVAERSITCTRW